MSGNRGSVLGIVPVVAILGAFWFLVVGPTRADTNSARAQLALAATARDAARATSAQAEQARAKYPDDFATVRRLAEAVPADENLAALVRGLDSLARASKLDFRTITMGDVAAEVAPAAAAPAGGAAAPDGAAKGATGDGAAKSATGDGAATPAEETPPAGKDAAAATPPAQGATPATGAAAAAAGQAPAGTSVGSAGLETMPFTFTVDGGFLAVQRFLRALHAKGSHSKDRVRISGRLLSIDGFALAAGRRGFPQVGASISATAYLEPSAGDAAAGATARGPAPAAATAPSPTPDPAPAAP